MHEIMAQYKRKKYKIEDIKEECPDTKTFFLDKFLSDMPFPGQFLMVNVTKGEEKIGERPFSLSSADPVGITVKRAEDPDTEKPGKVTSFMLDSLKKGDTLEIMGPFGNTLFDFYDSKKTICLVGGGCGAALLRYFAEYLRNSGNKSPMQAFIGAKDKNSVLFKDDFSQLLEGQVTVGVDDPGKPGKVVELLDSKIKPGTQVYVCGPRPLLKAVADLAAEYIDPEDIILSTEPIMKCGRGVCGSCYIGKYCACQDGPNFTYEVLKETEFFQYRRTKSGRRIPL